MLFLNAKLYEEIKHELFEYGYERVDLFAQAPNINFLAELMSDMEEYESYTWFNTAMNVGFPMFTCSLAGECLCTRMEAEQIVYPLFGYDAVNAVVDYREQHKTHRIGLNGFLEILVKFCDVGAKQ